MSELDIRLEIWEAWMAVGLLEVVGRSFLAGRREVLETEVGIDSGIGSDIFSFLLVI